MGVPSNQDQAYPAQSLFQSTDIASQGQDVVGASGGNDCVEIQQQFDTREFEFVGELVPTAGLEPAHVQLIKFIFFGLAKLKQIDLVFHFRKLEPVTHESRYLRIELCVPNGNEPVHWVAVEFFLVESCAVVDKHKIGGAKPFNCLGKIVRTSLINAWVGLARLQYYLEPLVVRCIILAPNLNGLVSVNAVEISSFLQTL